MADAYVTLSVGDAFDTVTLLKLYAIYPVESMKTYKIITYTAHSSLKICPFFHITPKLSRGIR